MTTEDTVTVHAIYHDAHNGGARNTTELTLPSWCSGDPAAAVALYLFGYADAVAVHKIVARVV
jgi:hypothetical protein